MIIYSLAINSNGDIFAGTDLNGFFRSTDNGDNWTNLGLMNLKTTGICIKPDGDILLINLDHQMAGGVFHSVDNGNSFTNMGFTSPGSSIAINSNGHIFVGTLSQGVYRSTDNGGYWVQINQGLTDLHPNSFTKNTSGDIFVGTMFGGVFRSTNNGNNWIQINQGLTTNYILSLAIKSNGDIFAGTQGGGVFRSTNNGNNWAQINQGLAGEGLYIASLEINLTGNIYAATGFGIFRSTNNGNSWDQINQGLQNINIYSLAINSNGDVFAGTADGVFRSLYSATSINTSEINTISNFELYQNYPNPFNPSTKIRYQLPNESKVVIKIYNILGSEVLELLNEQKEAGIYEVEFNSDNLSTGTYIYKIYADNFVQTKKMILLK
jgi:ligand-binding sensor domain-containing protein